MIAREYMPRLVDNELALLLKALGGVSVEGAKVVW
jgi:hypothetical protein